MALTAEQKATILKRRDTLIASGSSITDATKIAFDEVVGPGQFESKLATKAGRAGPVVSQPASPPLDEKETKKKTETQNLQTSLVQAEQDWVRSRKSELKELGYGDAEAASQAQREFNQQFGPAPAAGFGEYAERKEDYLLPVEKLLPDVLRRKTFIPEDKTVQEVEASRFKIDASPFQTTGIPTGIGPDFRAIKETLKKDSKLSEEEAIRQTEAFRQAYDKALKDEIALSQIGQPRADLPDVIKVKDATVTPEELAQKALKKAIAEIEGIQSVSYIQPEKARSEELRKVSSSTLEQLGLALGKQETAGQGVPDYSDVQLAYLKSLSDTENEKIVSEKLKAGEKKNVYEKDGKVISEKEYKALSASFREDSDITSYKKKEVPKTESDIRAELAEIPWYLDPAKKKKYLLNPEKYAEEGILSDKTIYGGQRETVTGQLLRGALILPNAVAGATSGIFEGFGEGGEAVAAEKRRRRPEAFKDSPILYNIAENRGFFGEGQETADIIGLEGGLRALYLGGTFAADILDPSLDVLTAAGKGLKVSRQAAAASRSLGALAGNSSAVAAGIKAAANDILDNTFLSVVAKDSSGAPARFKNQDPRTLATSELTSSLSASQKVADDIKIDPTLTSEAAAAKLTGDPKFKDTGYAKLYSEKAAAGRSADEVAKEIMGSEDLIKRADEISKGLDEVLEAGSTRLIRSKELARQLGAMAATDSRVADAFRAVDSAPVSGVQKISQYVKALDADQIARLKKGLTYDTASTAVYKATKEMSALDNLVAVTKNTFVDKSILDKIMAKASASKIGQISKSLADAKIVFKGRERGVSQAFEVTDAIKADIQEVAGSLAEFRKLDAESLRRINRDLASGFIATSDLRRLVDANVDLIAEGVASSGSKVARARDIARLPVSKQLDLLVPLESRAFTREVLKEWFSRMTSRFKNAPSKLSIGQQQLLKEAFGRAGSLDIKLRTAIQDLISTKATGEGSARAAYGIPTERAPLTKSEALSYAIVGPVGARRPEDIKDVLDFGLQNLFYNKSQKQDIFNLFNGVDIARETSVLSQNGKTYFDGLMDNAAKRINDNPESLFPELIAIQEEMRTIIAKAKSDPQVAQEFFRVNPNEIVDIAAEGAQRLSAKITGKTKPIPQEVSVGLYYKSEADRIQKELISDLVNTEIGKGQVALTDTIKEDYYNFIKSVENRTGISLLDNYPKITTNRIQNILENPAWRTTPIEPKDIENMLGVDAATASRLISDNEAMSAISTIIERSEDIALNIIRQKQLSTATSLDDIEKSLEGIVKGTGPEDAQLKLLFGDDAADQLKNAMTKGFDSLKEDLRTQLIRGYEGRGSLEAVRDTMANLFEKINDFRYTFLLNLRPRFHGANLATAADIYYQTTGKLPNYIDAARGLALTDVARRDPNRIMLSSKTKAYTAREVYDLLSSQGGRSVYTLTAPNLANKRALQLTDDDFKVFGDWWRSFGNLPTIEDMAFRYSVFADAIRAGRSQDEALELARKSMFDAADITELERPLQKLLMFYGFARNNFVNFAKNMASPEGQKRIIKFLRTERNANNINTTEEDREFSPGYTQTKAIYGKLPVSDEKNLYLTTPALATKEAVKLFGEILRGNVGEVLTGMVNPTYKEILGVSGSFDRDPKKISPEHIAFAKVIPGATPGDIFSWIAGSEIVPRAAKPEDGAVDGYIYPLTTPSQIKRYKTFIDLLSYSGIAAPTTDWARTVFGQGTPVEQLNFGGKTAYALGGMTPSYGIPAWKQDYFNKLSKLQAIKESAGKIEKEVLKETAVESAAIPQKMEAAEIEAAVVTGQAERAEAKSGYARLLQLRAELKAAQPPNTKILESYNYDADRMYEEYVKPRVEELEKLDAELNPPKAPSKSAEGSRSPIKVAPIKIAPIKVIPIKR